MKYRDRRTLGRSELVPFLPDESASERHSRRLHANLEARTDVASALTNAGFDLVVKNDGQHWIIRKGEIVWEWWPSSAKLVRNKNWRAGVHCHDYKQLLNALGVDCA